MGTLLLIFLHIVFVTALYITAYRTGYGVCRDKSRRQAEIRTAPLMETLEQLNLDIERFLDDDQHH